MKKLIIILLFSVGLQAQNSTVKCKSVFIIGSDSIKIKKYYPILVDIELKNQTIEIDGHQIKSPVYFKATLDSIEIYDKKNNKYQVRKCNKENCSIIHLEPKLDYTQNGSIRLAPWLLNNTTSSKTGL